MWSRCQVHFLLFIVCVHVTQVTVQGQSNLAASSKTREVNSGSQANMTEDEKRREEILQVVNDLSSQMCKDNALVQMEDRNQCLQAGCAKLEQLYSFMSVANCSEDDYKKLHNVICSPDDPPCTSTAPETSPAIDVTATKGPGPNRDQIQRQQIRCVMFNQLSSQRCHDVVAGQTSEDADIQAGCTKLESFKSLVTVLGCTMDDYTILHNVICTWDGKESCTNYYQMQQELITQTEHQLKPSCNKSVSTNIKTEIPSEYCTKLLQAKDGLLANGACNSSEIDSLEKAVCCTGIVCFRPIDTSTRIGKVTLAIWQLTSRCSRTMTVAINTLSQSPEKACEALESTKPALLGGTVCTEEDYSKLQIVVCNSNSNNCPQGSTDGGCITTPDPFANEREQRNRIQEVIQNDLDSKCQSFMMEQASSQISDPLEKTCKNLLDNKGFIVVGELCSEQEYGKLKMVICGHAGTIVANIGVIIASAMFMLIKFIL